MLTIQDLQGNRKQANRERLMRTLFGLAAILSIAISLLILYVLVDGAINFMVGIDWDWSLLTDTGWFPRRERFDLRTIITGSIIMGTVAMFVAVPFGLGTAIYLSEYASRRVRSVVKPIIEVLAGIPSVIVGLLRPEGHRSGLRRSDLRSDHVAQHARRRARHRHPGDSDHGVAERGCAERRTGLAPRSQLRRRSEEGHDRRPR